MDPEKAFQGWKCHLGNVLEVGKYRKILKSETIMGFKFFERENKNYMSKVKFVIFSILFTECFYYFSILRN